MISVFIQNFFFNTIYELSINNFLFAEINKYSMIEDKNLVKNY